MKHIRHKKTSVLIELLKSYKNTRNGRGDRIRTCGPLVPNQVRYQTAPRPDNLYIITYYVVKVKRFFRFLYYFYIIFILFFFETELMIKTVKLNSRGYISAAVLRLISTFNTDAVKDIEIIVDRVVFFVIAANIHYCFSVMHHNGT